MIWTKEKEAVLTNLYSSHTNREIAELTGWDYYDVMYKGKKMGLKKDKHTKQRAAGITPWTLEQLAFLRDNFYSMTNHQLAEELGITLTVVRNKTSELGLKRIDMEYWSDEQIQYLVDNFRTMGDMEFVHYFQEHYPKNKPWTRSHINKKRRQMGLHRTPEEIAPIVHRNVSAGGPSCTMPMNSASKLLPDRYVANCIAWRDPELKEEVLKHPDIIQLKREQIQLARAIKEVKNGA